MARAFPTLTAEGAAEMITHGSLVGVSGFTPAGSPKVVPAALAKRARALHEEGEPFEIRLLSGASTGPMCDDALAEARAISWRAPYMTSGPFRKLANSGQVDFIDMHLSHVAQVTAGGFLGKMDVAIVEAVDVTAQGRVHLTTGIGNAPTALIEVVRLIKEEGARPALVIGMPVGFVSAAESKDLMAEVQDVPWIVIRGRKGGSTLVVAAIHALLGVAEARQRNAA